MFKAGIDGQPKIMGPDKYQALRWVSILDISDLPLVSYVKRDFIRLGWLK